MDDNTNLLMLRTKRLYHASARRVPLGSVCVTLVVDASDRLVDASHSSMGHSIARFLHGRTEDMTGWCVYVSLFPCKECLKMLSKRGVPRVVILRDPPMVLTRKPKNRETHGSTPQND